jgi:dipeptidyl aminopeptidase/acylaminoacyl peptidase
VVYGNPRGSTSYGEDFANKIHYHYPEHDFDDLMSIVDAAIANGSADPDNLFVTGQSGGGILTAWTVGSTHRFRAAVSQSPAIDWTSWSVTTDVYAYVARNWFRELPWEDHATYWKQSPLSRVGNVTTPTLMIAGGRDLRTPQGQAEEFYQALQLRNIPTGLVIIPGAFHAEFSPSQMAAQVGATLAWFDRFRTSETP